MEKLIGWRNKSIIRRGKSERTVWKILRIQIEGEKEIKRF